MPKTILTKKTILTNVIYDKNGNEIIFYKNAQDTILYLVVANKILLQAKYSDVEYLNSCIWFEPHPSLHLYPTIDADTATAIVAYLWNERQQDALITGYGDLVYSDISLSYHIMLRANSVFDVAIGDNLDPSYSINLSSSDIRLEELRELGSISMCTNVHGLRPALLPIPAPAPCEDQENMMNDPLNRSISSASNDSAISVEHALVSEPISLIQSKPQDFTWIEESKPIELGEEVSATNEGPLELMSLLSGTFSNAATIDAPQCPECLLGQLHDTTSPAWE